MQIEDRVAREWHMREDAEQHWSTRQLERQIFVLYYATAPATSSPVLGPAHGSSGS
ncbi:MAG: hypothetical protein ACREMY_10460 [bacterium]